MLRRILTGAVLALALALGGGALAAGPVHAGTPTGTASTDGGGDGCPLTPMQLKQGREVLTSATTLLNHPAIKPHRPKLVVESQNSMLGDAADCMLAVMDIQRKSGAVQDAQMGYLACLAASVIDGRSCAAEMSNLRAAIHDLELAVFLLEQRCPWLRI